MLSLREVLQLSLLGLLGVASCIAAGDDSDFIDSDESALSNAPPGDDGTPPPSGPIPAIVNTFTFGGLWIIDFADGSIEVGWKDGDAWRWPVAHDLRPHYVHLIWRPWDANISALVPEIANPYGSYSVQLWINGVNLSRGKDADSGDFWTTYGSGTATGCPSGKTCLYTSVNAPVFLSFSKPWNVKLVIRDTHDRLDAGKTFTGKVAGNPAPYSFFQAEMIPTFRHPNCSTCHTLGNSTLLTEQHGPYKFAVSIDTHQGPNGTQLRCFNGCHHVEDVVYGETFNETVWMTPGFDQDINFNTKTDAQICAKVKQRLPTDDALLEHFLEDARIAWAVHSGVLPDGSGAEAPPYSYGDFAAIIQSWVAGGSPCP